MGQSIGISGIFGFFFSPGILFSVVVEETLVKEVPMVDGGEAKASVAGPNVVGPVNMGREVCRPYGESPPLPPYPTY